MGRALAACAAIIAALAGCSERGRPLRPLAVASVRQPATSLLLFAETSGCLSAEHLQLQERSHELGRDALQHLLDGSADLAVAYETPFLRAAFADRRLRVLTRLHTSTLNTRLVVRTGSEVRDFPDLAGKRVALARGTNAEFFAGLAFVLGGVRPGAASIVDLAPAESVASLVRGEVDGAVLSDPFAGEAELALGAGGRTLRTSLYAEASLLITREEVVEARRPELLALLRGLACAERRARADPAEARRKVSPRFPELAPEVLEAELGRVSWGLGLDNVLVDVLRQQGAWLSDSAGLAPPPALHPLLVPGLLEAVDPESVTLLASEGHLAW